MTRRSRTTRRTRDRAGVGLERRRLDGVGVCRLRLSRVGSRGRLVHEPVLLGARADREPRLARGAVPAALGGVRRRGTGARVRRSGHGDVPVRDRVHRLPVRDAVGGRAELADLRRRPRGGGDPDGDRRRDRAEGRRLAEALRAHHPRLRLAGRDRSAVPHRPPARVRDHVDRAARRGGRRGHPRLPHASGSVAGVIAVLGPTVVWYLVVAAVLFGTGALGVLIRRNPLIVLLSLEIMLNGGNLALIAFARRWGNGDGQIFALAVMAIAASEVVVGLGLIVAIHRRRLALDVDKLSFLRG